MVDRQICGETVLIPVRNGAADLSCLYVLNSTAALIWQLVDGIHDVAHLATAVLREFEVDPLQAEKDLTLLLADLQAARLIRLEELPPSDPGATP